MAQMIPENLSTDTSPSSRPTIGEQRIFHLLHTALKPDKDFIVWYELPLHSKRPDFVIWSNDFGLLILEVKDWTLSQIKEISSHKFTVEISGKMQSVDTPLTQSWKAYKEVMDEVKKHPTLLHTNGNHLGQPKFPIGYGAILTNISKQEADESRVSTAVKNHLCLYKNDIRFDEYDSQEQQAFINKLKPLFNSRVMFDCPKLTSKELETLKGILFSESIVPNIRKNPHKEILEIKTLDFDQERIAKSINSGHRILKGVAGSGKTLVVAARAQYLKKCNPNWRILVVAYNIAVSKYLKQLIHRLDEESIYNQIDIFHFMGAAWNTTGITMSNETGEYVDREKRYAQKFREATNKMSEISGGSLYDAILIDEGQDFTTDMVQGFIYMLNTETDSLLFCYDPNQNVFGRETPVWKEAGLKVQGKKAVEIHTSYRSTYELTTFATLFSKTDSNTTQALETPLYPSTVDRHGYLPVLKNYTDLYDIATSVCDTIKKIIASGKYTLSEIGILYSIPYDNFQNVFVSTFSAEFDSNDYYWVSHNDRSKHNLDLTAPSVKLSTIESCKGLEFKVVFLIGLDTMPRASRDEETERRLAYVGITRTQDVLYIPYCKESGFIPEIKAILNSLKAKNKAN